MLKFVTSLLVFVMVYHSITVTAVEQCPTNQEWTDCGTACPKTCDTSKEPTFCTLQCVVGCRCKEGYVLNSAGDCVKPCDC